MATPEDVGMSSPRFRLITQMLEQHIEDGRVAGLVAGVAHNGKVVYLESMGWQDIEQQLPMRDDSIFQIRSMSKPITAVAVMQLVETGRLNLTDPVSKYLPRYAHMEVFVNPDDPNDETTRAASREMTIEDLLLNTSGLSHRFGVLYTENAVRSRADTLEQLVDKVAAVPLVADPGTRWVYSIASTVLGRIVEIVSAQTFDDYLLENVFSILQMGDSGFYVAQNKVNRLARAYSIPRGDGTLTRLPDMDIPITQNPPLLEGAAGMVSSVPDYLRFLQSLLNEGELDGSRVLAADTVRSMVENHIDDALMPIGTNPRNPMLDRGWGYGFAVVTDKAMSSFGVNNGEFGWNGSLGTFSWADPETNTAVVLMLQVSPSGAFSLSSKFKALVYQTLIDH
ncbi:MAG: beta-lactamase family protein [Proteobacteria bacterium]|nr:beta-lactamase family protein [Pseudomonadota bacterium]